MTEATFHAFLIGIFSALSLPLGALTAQYWRPRARMIAFLMAFGAGALLAALSIDLVGEALHRGEFRPMAIGCLLGGILFVLLNQIVNYHGGFLRKSSTMINYLQFRRQLRLQRVLSNIKRLPIFKGLNKEEKYHLVERAISRFYPAGSTLFQLGDPSNRIYIIESGEAELRDPNDEMRLTKELKKGEAFGWMSMLTGLEHQRRAVAKTDIQLWIWSRDDFDACLHESPRLKEHLCRFLKNQSSLQYLSDLQNLTYDQAQKAMDQTCRVIIKESVLPEAQMMKKEEHRFKQVLKEVKRVPIFQHLNNDDLELIVQHVFLKKYGPGHSLFLQDEYADRMYFLKKGKVALLDPSQRSRTLPTIHPHEAFGYKSFLTGSRHSVSAASAEPIEVWVLLRRDMVELINRSPSLNKALQEYLTTEDMKRYLSDKQHLDEEKMLDWQKRAKHDLEAGQFVPSASEMAAVYKEHAGKPLAIWLGILLDGIPESLVIGSSMIHGPVSLSLLAGVFISNYPEALSSSVGMQEQKMSRLKILMLWSSITLITGIGAGLGQMLFMQTPTRFFSFTQGIAAGSMLTMIAETMLPEAYLKGGAIVGLSTLAGFLTALFFKTLGG